MSKIVTKAKIDRSALAPWERGELVADDVQYEVTYLWHLLDATAETLSSMEFVRNGKRDKELDRVDALVRLARDHMKRIEVAIENS